MSDKNVKRGSQGSPPCIYQMLEIGMTESIREKQLLKAAELGLSEIFCSMYDYLSMQAGGPFSCAGVVIGFPFGGYSLRTILSHLEDIADNGAEVAKVTIGSRHLTSGTHEELKKLIAAIDEKAKELSLCVIIEIQSALLTLDQIDKFVQLVLTSSFIGISLSTGTPLDHMRIEHLNLVDRLMGDISGKTIYIPYNLYRSENVASIPLQCPITVIFTSEDILSLEGGLPT